MTVGARSGFLCRRAIPIRTGPKRLRRVSPSPKVVHPIRLSCTSIHSPRLLLRPPHDSDADALHIAQTESWEDMCKWFDYIRPGTPLPQLIQTRAQIRKDMHSFAQGRSYPFYTFLRESECKDSPESDDEDETRLTFIGVCGISRVSSSSTYPGGIFELAYWLRPSHRRRGLATEACTALVRLLQNEATAQRVTVRAEIRCDVANTRSIALARRLGGFVEDGHPSQPNGGASLSKPPVSTGSPVLAGEVSTRAAEANARARRIVLTFFKVIHPEATREGK